MNDVVICIPSWRPPPIKSLESFETGPYPVLIVADPRRYQDHVNYYYQITRSDMFKVVMGGEGNGPQCASCYRRAAEAGFPFFFKMDDDLLPNTFVTRGGNATLIEAIQAARECLGATNTRHAGFSNSSRRDWLGEGFGRTYGLIHGGGNIGISAHDPSRFIDERLVRGEDVYRTCAHREADGAVGRVRFIGFDKKGSADTSEDSSSKTISQEDFNQSRDLILQRFPGMVTCNGTRWIHNGTHEIANWKMKKLKGVDR